MYIEQATEIKKPKTRCVLYAQAGMGKTSIAKILSEQGLKVLVIDVDRSTVVLKGMKNIQIIYLAEDFTNEINDPKVSTLKEITAYLQLHAAEYDLIFFDNVSQLEKNMLTWLGKKGKNDGVPSQGDYQKMQFKIYELTKNLLMLDTNVIITAWEIVGGTVSAEDGQQGFRLEPHMSAKIVNYVLGLANVVAHYEKGMDKETGEEKRWLRLSSTKSAYAKDQVNGRSWCKLGDLLGAGL